MLKNIFIINILMASQETMDFVKNIIKNILSKWESLPP